MMRLRAPSMTVCLAAAAMLAAACGSSTNPSDSGVLPCSTGADCPDGWLCSGGVCVADDDGCTIDADCPDGQRCIDGRCRNEQSDGGIDGGDGGDGSDGGDQAPEPPLIAVEPELIDFGNARIGESLAQPLVVRNAGGSALTLFSVRLETGTSEEFSAEPTGNLNRELVPGEELTVVVHYQPVDGVADQGGLLISSDDPANALLRVPLSSSYKGTSELTVVDDPSGDLLEVETVDFGAVAVGTEAQRRLVVLNTGTGNAVLTVAEVRTQPLSSDHFSLVTAPQPPLYLSPHLGACGQDADCEPAGQCQDGLCVDGDGVPLAAVAIAITFAPGQVGAVQESLVIANDEEAGAGDETVRIITLRGEGIQPALDISPNPIDFGHLFVGQQAEQTVTLTNTGGQTLNIDQIALADGSGPFSLSLPGAAPWQLAPGEQLEFGASFAPLAAGEPQDQLRIDSDDPEGPALVDLLGSASQPPVLAVEPAALDFGEVQLAEQAQQHFLIRNTGGSPLSVLGLELVGGAQAFGLVQQAVPDIAPGDSARVDVTYAPSGAVGADSNLVRVTSNDPLQPEALVDLSGIGTDPALVLDPQQFDFGPIYQGYTAGPQLIAVRNEGFGQLTIDAIALGDGSSPDFVLGGLPALPAALTSGQSLQVEVRFTPSGSGVRTAAIEVASSDRDRPLGSVALSGSGSDCPEGFWDINGDPADGCEYACDLTNGGIEACDGVDNDCDGDTDDGLTSRSCSVENLYGTCTGSESCDGVNGWVNCDAATPEQEVCDGLDNDCDTAVDAADNDLLLEPCDQQQGVCAGAVHRAAQCAGDHWEPCQALDYGADYGAEVCDGLDNDCDGLADAADGDLQPALCELQQGVCAGASKPAALCLGEQGWAACGPDEYAGHDARYGAETCDGADNDCNGLADASDPALVLTACALQAGVCAGSEHLAGRCVSGSWEDCGAAEYGADYGAEVCDGLDNDCDGDADIDDGSLVIPDCENQTGVCAGATKPPALCQGAGGWAACGPDEYEAHDPDFGAETCDGHDNDCDGFVDAADADLVIALCEDQDGVCAGAEHRSSLCQGGGWLACEATDYEANDPDYDDSEICDGRDNNCDTQVDEGLNTRQCSLANAYGECFGSETCDGLNGWVDCDAATPEQEVCDGDDNDCDSYVDGDDNSLQLALCDLQEGVCAGAVHDPSQCNGVDWDPCTAFDYTSHDANYGVEVCGNALDEDCSGAVDDKDVDADGYVDVACSGGDDCDDDDPATYPGAAEVQDAADNDCDDLVDEGLIPAGAVIVSEIMKNPDGVSDAAGEYFEVTNDWTVPVNLHSWTIADQGSDAFSVVAPAGIVIDAGESAVFCINADYDLNGGVVCDYDFDNFQLGNGADEVVLALDGAVIDAVVYDDGPDFPDPQGKSMSLDPAAYDAAANDDGSNWCATPTDAAYALASGDHGTPGQFNPSCAGALAVLDANPDSGIEFGGEIITITGAGFSGATAVTVGGLACLTFTVGDDSTITCLTPPLAPGDHDVTVTKGPNVETLTDGYRSTGEEEAPAIGWCALQWPQSTTTSSGAPSELIFGRVYQAGVTEPAGPPPGIGAQIGYGPLDSDPRTTPGWRWVVATWNPSCPDCGNDDEFMESLTVTIPGQYSYAVRFSEDGGYHFTFCDLPPGTDDGFSSAELGTLTVNP